MDLGRQLALTQPWWMWKEVKIKKALAQAKLQRWLPVVRNALERNRSSGRSPSTMAELAGAAYLARDTRNITRLQSGHYHLTDQHLLGLAISLHLPVSALLPEPGDWISNAVCILCPKVPAVDAQVYAGYRIARAYAPPDRYDATLKTVTDEQILAAIGDKPATVAHVRDATLRVADNLGALLIAIKGTSA